MSQGKLNYYLIKINRVIVWILLILMIVFIVTGYGLTRPNLIYSWTGGQINYEFSDFLHSNLDVPLIILFFIHVLIEVKFSLMRWGIKNHKLLNLLILVLGIISITIILYINSSPTI